MKNEESAMAGTDPELGGTDQRETCVVRCWHLYLVLESDRLLAGGARYDLQGVDEVAIGRGLERGAVRTGTQDAGRLDVSVPTSATSRKHALLRRRGDDWYLTDTGSMHGTFVNERKIDGETPVEQRDLIQIGHAFFTLRQSLLTFDADPKDAPFGQPEPPLLGLAGFPTLVPFLAYDLEGLRKAIETDEPIAIIGDTGTGKEVLAHVVHQLSERRGAFVAINCATLETLPDSTLFGYVKGAYSGAVRDDPGKIRAANGGTLMLDEVVDLPVGVQAKLLRVVQDREVVPIGATQGARVDVRFIVAAQRRLEEVVAEGRFRADLHQRLDTFPIWLPPLRERPEDLGLLLAAILRERNVAESDSLVLPSNAVLKMWRYAWPGNVRELRKLLIRSLTQARDGVLSSAAFPESVEPPASRLPDRGVLSEVDWRLRERLRELLERHQGNAAAVARDLNLHRETVRRYLRRFNLDPDAYKQPRPKGGSAGPP